MDVTQVLIIKDGADDPVDGIVRSLADDPAIVLATPAPVDVDAGIATVRLDASIEVVLIISREARIPGIVSAIRAVRANIHLIALALETGTANLSLRDPNFAELNSVIHTLARPARGLLREKGKVLRFTARLPANDTRADPAEATADPAPRRNLPVVTIVQLDPKSVDAIDLALEWVEAATRVLVTMWSDHKDGAVGFALSWGALERWLGDIVGLIESADDRPERSFRRLTDLLDQDDYTHVPLATLYRRVERDPLALKIALIAAAADLDIRFHRLFGALHDDFARRYPSVGLACAIIAAGDKGVSPAKVRGRLATNAHLRRLGLTSATGPLVDSAEAPLKLAATVVDWLLTGDADALIGADARQLRRALPIEAGQLLSAERLRRVRAAVRHALIGRDGDRVSAIMLDGSAPDWMRVEAAEINDPALMIGPAEHLAPEPLAAALADIAAAAYLSERRVVADLDGDGPAGDALWQALTASWALFDQPPFIIADNPARRLAAAPQPHIVVADLPAPARKERRDMVAAALAELGGGDAALIDRIADGFPVPIDAVPQAVAIALAQAAANGRPNQPDAADWLSGFRRIAGARLPTLARRIEPPALDPDQETAPLDAVVLPAAQRDQLAELVSHVRHSRTVLEDWGYAALTDGQGIAALFSGDSGTGKTTAAYAIAAELGADLYAIDLAQVVSKYIGETEKNLDLVFDDAQRAGAVLLFDEADALFGKRSAVSDARDRYANIEVAHLLQRIQRFTGLALLTTNHADNLDPAFTRRLRFCVQFPRPTAADRLTIWEQSFPAPLRAEPLDLRAIAFAFDLTGGTIRQMAVHAAMLAAEQGGLIRFDHVLSGVRSQLVRLGHYTDIAKLDAIVAGTRAKAA
ncbi:ATP-binding protein [Sphingomonas bacterium]|uniref:ATP-binding protein n=1 Tax=Sphingomonas bacterium TaxID=1895847 RepID=UPI00260B61B3|nr:ATP-binding protein [Sphingomonas bacterium]MDB5678516.1 ATP-binding protein [Sphingomonas bacterium]